VVHVLTQQSLASIQGNILAPFNKPVQCFVFVNFRNSAEAARKWLTALVDEEKGIIVSTQDVLVDSAAHTADEPPPKPYLAAVGLTASALVTLRRQFAEELVPYDSFWQGALADREGADGVSASAALVGDVAASAPNAAS
jgi:hypothetical protein